MLALSALLVLLPLIGVGVVFYQDPTITVDNLFISLMLLTISGLFALNAAGEVKRRIVRRKQRQPQTESAVTPTKAQSVRSLGAAASAAGSPLSAAGRQRGIVRDVQFFESPVGVPNKSIVSLQMNGANSTRMFAFEGDLRDVLPRGKKVELSFRDTGGALDLQEVNYV